MTGGDSALWMCKHMRQRIVKWQAGVSARNDEVGGRGRLLSASVGKWTQAQGQPVSHIYLSVCMCVQACTKRAMMYYCVCVRK